MNATRPHDHCPYTLTMLSELPSTSDEHIIPDALGGCADYVVRADTQTNSMFGTTVDASFVSSPLIAGFCSKIGVKTRTGLAALTVPASLIPEGNPVEVTLPHQGAPEVHFKKPVQVSPEHDELSITAGPERAAVLQREIEAAAKKKGRKISSVVTRSLREFTVKADFSFEISAIRAGMFKIAYLATFELLGDDFLGDPLNREWQKAIRATDSKAFEELPIRCSDGFVDNSLDLIGPTAEHEHAVVVANMPRVGLIAAAKLFGFHPFSLCCLASETSTYGLIPGEGKRVICSAKTKSMRATIHARSALQ